LTQPPAISLRGVSKKYRLYDSLSHRIYEALHPFKKRFHREFWALRDVTLDIPRGATVGILGVNGSGKSTLLQLICSILHPTSGSIEVRGKVAALIELGAGFNPDLTGRENVEVNCAIMGLDGKAVRERLPEIETFADIGEFFDQPVKIYSSGMFMRVAFATAISVDPDILVIDEALAVGDAKFQEKCFQKFREFQAAGKTILLVTHDRFAVPRLCNLGLVLHKGELVQVGDPNEIVNLYAEILAFDRVPTPAERAERRSIPAAAPAANDTRTNGATTKLTAQEQVVSFRPHSDAELSKAINGFVADLSPDDRCALNPTYNKHEHRYGDRRALVVDYLVIGDDRINPDSVPSGTDLHIYMKVRFCDSVEDLVYGFTITTTDGLVLFGTNTGHQGIVATSARPGDIRVYQMSVKLELGPGNIFFTIGIAEGQTKLCDIRQSCVHILVSETRSYVGVTRLKTALKEIASPGPL
jgi:lipopolysaccharide transport system ATP-binding protein